MVPEGWTENTLEALTSKNISYGIVQTGEPSVGDIPCVRVVDLTKRVLSTDDMITTTPEINHSYRKTILEPGEIMLALRGKIGLVRMVSEDLEGCNLTRGIARIAADQARVLPNYLLWALRSPSFRIQLLRRVNGSALQEVPLGELKKTPLLVPPLAEQEKIAEILSTWDDAIETVEHLIVSGERQLNALTQKLLTGEQRLAGFSGDYPTVPVSDIARIQTGSSNREDSAEEGEFTFFDRSTEIRRSDKYLFDTEAIIVGGEGKEFIPKYFVGKFDLHQRAYVLSDFRNAIGKYVYFSLNFYRHLLKRYAVGSTVPSLRMGTFDKVTLWLPSVPEQEAIAKVLSLCASEIDMRKRDLSLLKQEKSALMQQLLTGKRRVRVDEAVESAYA